MKIYWRIKNTIKFFLGKNVISKIKRAKSQNDVLIYAGPFMGDALYILSFLEEFKKHNPNKNVIILAPTKNIEKIAQTFIGYDRIYLISKLKSKVLRLVLGNTSILRMAQENGLYKTPINWDYSITTDLIDRIHYEMFQLDDRASLHYHQFSTSKVTCIPKFYEDFRKIVVINSFSNSMKISKEAMTALENLVRHLKAGEGKYIIYSNVIKNQQPIRGTLALRCSLSEFLEIANYIPFIISIRSGILDFVVKTNLNMFVIYSDKGIDKARYSLKSWRCKGEISEQTMKDFIMDKDYKMFDNFLQKLLIF